MRATNVSVTASAQVDVQIVVKIVHACEKNKKNKQKLEICYKKNKMIYLSLYFINYFLFMFDDILSISKKQINKIDNDK
jgi:hypothetical protein